MTVADNEDLCISRMVARYFSILRLLSAIGAPYAGLKGSYSWLRGRPVSLSVLGRTLCCMVEPVVTVKLEMVSDGVCL